MHELASVEVDPAGPDVEFFQKPKKVEELLIVRCPSCQGLRGVPKRNIATASVCNECRRGHVVPKSQFHNYWTKRFTFEEIQEMAVAIWG